jgi:hypothetical protein
MYGPSPVETLCHFFEGEITQGSTPYRAYPKWPSFVGYPSAREALEPRTCHWSPQRCRLRLSRAGGDRYPRIE